MKSIYKIENLLNGKIYIGQTNRLAIRIKQHQNANSYIGSALRKYGVENFNIIEIEKTEFYDERERFWIEHYHSNNPNKGYNLTLGGSGNCQIATNQIQQVVDFLKNTSFTFIEIQNFLNIGTTTIGFINNGQIISSEREYPIRFSKRQNLTSEEVLQIECQLFDLSLIANSIEEAVEQLEFSRTLIFQINNGKHTKSSKTVDYPIIKPNEKVTEEKILILENELQNSSASFESIAHCYNVNRELVNIVNEGLHRYSTKKGPIRKYRTILQAEEVCLIEQVLINKQLLKKDIALLFNRSDSTIRNINNGVHKFSNKALTFPLYK